MAAKRFKLSSADEIEEKKMLINSKETVQSNARAANVLRAYLKEVGQEENFEEFSNERLNEVLAHFYLDTRREDGEHYKATSLENLRHSLNRYLKSPPHNSKFDIIKDDDFREANISFKAALAELKREGKGSVDHHPIIIETDLQKLYSSKHMSPETPVGLQNKVQFDIRLYVCRRSSENMHSMSKSTFAVETDPKTGLQYVKKCVDELTKNHRGNDREMTSGVMPESSESDYCPVKSFQKYISKLHPAIDALWQRPRDTFEESEETWFCRQKVGEKTLSKFMSVLSVSADLSQVYTNHSIRATGATILTKNMFNPSKIMAVTGHKSVQSLTVYQRTDTDEKIAMGRAMAQTVTPTSDLPALPSTTKLALPAPESTCMDVALREDIAVAEMQGINVRDIFSDFNAPLCQSENSFSSVQSRQILPAFHSCTIGTINFNINISK